jgi:RimJ/RimL family protein N-acetyltransferase
MSINFRELQREDIPFLNLVRNDCAEEYLHNSTKFTLEQSYEWFDKTKPTFYTVFDDDVKIGYFRVSDYSHLNNNIQIGMDIHSDFRGRGLAYEAYCKFIPFLFKKYNLNKIFLEVLITNIRAYNLYVKLGFVREGVKRQEVLKNGKYIDSIFMSILKDEVENNKIYKV